jgi:MOSC domain-containing protein YiiM
MLPAMKLQTLSVNVARPQVLAEVEGQQVISAIAKQPVVLAEVQVGLTNIEGDGQADLSVHGGPDKAVYAYPADNWPWWRDEHAFVAKPASFGENLTVSGADETAVNIGDRFRWGAALLEVSQPRMPCFKMQLHAKRMDVAALLTVSGRCGWYLRVIEPGAAAIDAPMERVSEGEGANVRDTFLAAFNRRVSEDTRRQLAAQPALARAWKRALLRE